VHSNATIATNKQKQNRRLSDEQNSRSLEIQHETSSWPRKRRFTDKLQNQHFKVLSKVKGSDLAIKIIYYLFLEKIKVFTSLLTFHIK